LSVHDEWPSRARRGSTLALIAAACLASTTASAQGGIDVVHVNGPIYMLVGAGGNIAASVGLDGVLLVDSGSIEYSDDVLETLRRLQERIAANQEPHGPHWGAEGRSTILENRNPPAPPKPVRYIINTSASPERTGGNQSIGAEHGVTYTGGNVAGTIGDAAEGAGVWAHEAVLYQLIARAMPFGVLPTDTYYGKSTKLSHFFNGDGVRMINMPAAQADGATLVHFNRSDVIVTGDFFSQKNYPMIDLESGGSIDGVLDALNFVLDLAIPEFRTEGGTMVIPGYGRLSDSADVGYYRDMVTIIRDNIEEMITRGMSLRQTLAARPTKAYDARFGNEGGDWTADMFVEAVYRSLSE
jgi:cyclase